MARIPMRANSLRGFLGALLVALLPLGAAGDELSLYRNSLQGPERLRLFALTRIFDQRSYDPEVRTALRCALAQQGHYYDGTGTPMLRQDTWVFPVLGYDGNINGGVLNDRFRFGGRVFEADPEIRAKSGVVVGGGFGTLTRIALARGTFLDFTGAAEIAHSPRYDVQRSQADISACLRRNVAGWTFADLCRTLGQTRREMGASTRQTTRAALSSLHQIGDSYHEARVEVERADYETITQDSVTFGLRSVFEGVLPSISVSLAERIPGEMAYRSRVNAGVQVPYDGRFYGVFAWTQIADGGQFLGAPREDRTYGIGMSADMAQDVSLNVTYVDNRSTEEFFNYRQIELEIRFRDYRW